MLSRVRARIAEQATFEDAAGLWMDADSKAALEIVANAWLAVHNENESAQNRRKHEEEAAS